MLILAFPLMVGIAVSWLCGIQMFAAMLLLALSAVAMTVALLWQSGARWLFGSTLIVAFFALGVFSETIDRRQFELQWSGAKGCYEAVLLEAPHVGGKATRVRAVATRLGRDSIRGARREGVVYLYFENSVELESLTVGNRLYFEGKVQSPRNEGNPAEFDTEHYMYVQGVTGTAYLARRGWRLRKDAPLTLPMRAMLLREKVVALYSSLDIAPESQAILSALTVGEKRDLSKGVRNLYAAVGASHVLALSGLHLGILYMVLTLLFPVGGSRLLRALREGVILVVLWGFAAVAGFAPSVVRAALLFTLMSVSRCMQRDGSSMNSLAFAALVMLVINPRWLFDVGFQLSFSAVFSILLLVPRLDNLLGAHRWGTVYRYVAGIISVSMAAQIGTLPLVWYYFGAFPLYFLVTNFVVVPSAFAVMLLAVLLLLFCPIELVRNGIAVVLDNLISVVNFLLRQIESLPSSSVELPYIDAWGAYAVAVALIAVLYAVASRRWRFITVAAAAVLPLAGRLLYVSHRNVEPHIIFYNSKGFSAMQIVASRSCSYLVSSYPQMEVDVQYIAEPYWRREQMDEPRLLPYCCYSNYSDGNVALERGLVTFAGRRVKVISDEEWNGATLMQPVDCILLCRGFSGSIKELLVRYPSKFIIMDATLYAGSIMRIQRECRQLGVRCINLRETGARKLLVNGGGVRLVPVE